MYSVKAPEGQWRVYDTAAKTRASYTFKMRLNPFVAYDFHTEVIPFHLSKYPKAKELVELDDYQQFVEDNINEEKFKQNSKDRGARNVYGKVSYITGLRCMEIGWGSHIGPSPDSNSQWAGLGAYKKVIIFSCYMRKSEDYRKLRVVAILNIADKHLAVENLEPYLLSPPEIEEDFRRRIQRSFDSFDFYGFSQD